MAETLQIKHHYWILLYLHVVSPSLYLTPNHLVEGTFYLRQISRNHWNGNWLSSCSEVRQNPSARSEPHSHRVLVFLMRRHRGESTEEAWKALANNVVDSLFSSTKDNAKNPFETLLKLDSRPRLSQQSSNNFFITSQPLSATDREETG